MDSLTLTTCCRIVRGFNLPTATTTTTSATKSNPTTTTNNSISSLPPKPFTLQCSASKDPSPNLDHWDQMELKFGRLLGEDPKLTLAKIMARKSNPDVSYLEIEKNFKQKRGDPDEEIVYFSEEQRSRDQSSSGSLSLMRPVRKKGPKPVNLENNEVKQKKGKDDIDNTRVKSGNVPKIILRKPTSAYQEDEDEKEKNSMLRIKPNLLLKMGKQGRKEQFSDITLLKKPEIVAAAIESDQVSMSGGILDGSNSSFASSDLSAGSMKDVDVGASRSEAKNDNDASAEYSSDLLSEMPEIEGTAEKELQQFEQSDLGFNGQEATIDEPLSAQLVSYSNSSSTIQATLQGKPQRLDQTLGEISHPGRIKAAHETHNSNVGNLEENLISTAPLQEHEDDDWGRAEDLLKTGEREEVELISCSTRGFVASFGSLVGFLPYRNLGSKWKFLAFESWVRNKGLDPSMCKQNLGLIEGYELHKRTGDEENTSPTKEASELSQNMKLEDLLAIYNQEKMKFLSSFVGQRVKVNVVLADRNSRKLIFSRRPREKEELVEKKRSLMAKLSIGDVVKGQVKKITYFGIFVEIEGVPALIHQSEVSWDATLDPSSFFKIGQIVEAKVHQLDFAQERITLSLKEVTPDPLMEALESVIGDSNSHNSSIDGANEDIEWPDVESLIKELQQIEGVQSVSKGRFLLSPGLAPTFQVYMGSMLENQYKLLARAGNKVQEVIVEASLDKEELKAAILACTNRVE
ncbi:hypothetical protein Scep_026212 [Stephania cephalantha]|uniref:S1 motif domain-containing protein n=1 Tax=Stephania cephalantha TaxID=152367 RepID=A0AAP0EQA8_9MAGN